MCLHMQDKEKMMLSCCDEIFNYCYTCFESINDIYIRKNIFLVCYKSKKYFNKVCYDFQKHTAFLFT